MLKTPISFKGPIGHLETYFDESLVFEAFKLMLIHPLEHWRFNEESQLSYAQISDDLPQTYQLNLAWPIDKEIVGNCSCHHKKPCIHMTCLAIHNKSKLDQIPAFTQQIRALKDVLGTFSNWLNQQHFDPFPGMARHRLIYVFDHSEKQGLSVKLFKAYLTQDNRYEVKAEVDSSLFYKKQLPKFVALADQHVFNIMNQLGLNKTHHFTVQSAEHQSLLVALLKTGRCFWKACYRPPMEFDSVTSLPEAPQLQLTDQLYLLLSQNKVLNKVVEKQSPPIHLQGDDDVHVKLIIRSSWVELDWKPDFLARIDWAEVVFYTEKHAFNVADVSAGRYQLGKKQLEAVAAYCYQIEKLPSVHAHYEAPVNDFFDINDRYIGSGFTSIAPLLLALLRHGWKVEIDNSYRLNSLKSNEFYVQVDPSKQTKSDGWFDVEVGVKVSGQTVNLLPYLVKAIKTGQFDAVKDELLLRLDDGRFIDMPKDKVMQIVNTLNELYDDKLLNKDNKMSMTKHHLMRLAELKQDLRQDDDNSQLMQWLGSDEIKQKADALLQIKSLPEIQAPVGLKVDLRPYQLTGVAWLQFLTRHDLHGVLADDMGLGKTLQVLAHLLHLKNNNELNLPVLIIAPTSLLGNWHAEIAKFTPQLKSLILTGQRRKKYYNQLEDIDVLITSYGVMSRDYKYMTDRVWHTMVLDEAQAIKNRKTRVAKIAKSIVAKHRLCLSGTPIENHLGEMWSLFEFLMPGFLSTEKHFQQHFQVPIEKDNNTHRLQTLQKRLAPFILRRTKSQVAQELPEKSEIIKLIELTEQQASVYETIRISMADEIRKAIKHQKNNSILIGNALLRLRQICCHPALLKLDSIHKEADSAKLNWLTMAVPNLVEEGRKILIFSSFTSMLDIIGNQLNELKIPYLELTGKTPPTLRTERIAQFQDGQIPVFLISLKAGGAGINLTAADTVIHFDPWWNPAAEQQASDRAHRIGQDKQVFVYKLITHGTVEEKIHRLQKQKLLLADNLLATNTHISDVLSQHQWQDLLAPFKAE